jgi:hypothetical protein
MKRLLEKFVGTSLLITLPSIVVLVVAGQFKAFPTRHPVATPQYIIGTPGLGAWQRRELQLTEKEAGREDQKDTSSSPKAHGTLTIIATPDSNPSILSGTSASSIQDLDMGELESEDWDAIFYQVLKCPVAADEPFASGETVEDWQERFSLKFQQAIPAYPMLSQIWNLDIYITYNPQEVRQLHEECLQVKAGTSNKKALNGLAKLSEACEEALKRGYSLVLIPD